MSEIVKLDSGDRESALAIVANHYQTMVAFVRQSMKEGNDYGVIPGTDKPTLLKPGAEKLCQLFSLRPHFELLGSIVDFDKPLFHYHYRCTLYNRHGEALGQGDGNCNSREKRYEKQQYKVFDLANTVCKISQKRALVSTVLVVVGVSQFFTADLEDSEPEVFPRQQSKPATSMKAKIIYQTSVELKRLGWTNEQGKLYLQKSYNKSSRQALTDKELQEFLSHLKSLTVVVVEQA